MKDKIFIIWSGSDRAAQLVREKIDCQFCHKLFLRVSFSAFIILQGRAFCKRVFLFPACGKCLLFRGIDSIMFPKGVIQ